MFKLIFFTIIAFCSEPISKQVFGPGCYQVIDKKHYLYKCKFLSTQGTIFLQGAYHLVWNKTINCVTYESLIDQNLVKKIQCPLNGNSK